MQIVINRMEYRNVQLIQNGQEGNLYLAKQKNQEVVIKHLSLKEKEIKILEKLMSNPPSNFVKIIDFDRESYIVMEKGDGTLKQYLEREQFKQLSILQKIKLFEQIANGILELHSRYLIHRDLKPDNIIFLQQQDQTILKLIDTGQMDQLSDKVLFLSEFAGTENYRAPEFFQERIQYNNKIDIWALGLIFYEMITGQSLIQKKKQIKDSQYIKSKIESINMFKENIQELLYNMLEQSYFQRWSAQSLMKELQRVIEIMELKEGLQKSREQCQILQTNCMSLSNTNLTLQNQISSSTQKIEFLDLKLQQQIEQSNNQAATIEKYQTQIQIAQEMNSNFQLKIKQLEKQNAQLIIESEKHKSDLIKQLEEKKMNLQQYIDKENMKNQQQIEQSVQCNLIPFKHKKLVLFGFPGAGKTWVFNKIQGQSQRNQNESTTNFFEYFLNEQNVTIVDSPVFLDQSNYDEREETYNNYDSYFQKNSIDDIVLVVQYERIDLMKQYLNRCLKIFKEISAIIVTRFVDTQVISQNEEEQVRDKFKFCNSSIYFTNKNASQTDLLDIFFKINFNQISPQKNYQDIFQKYIK
ncbi:unnamed protein product (macronuclear) [Paramecium tetraurelia]|uniref:Protein kinase domain-containing protein n=1 Tax=Paramecium tetraurelia TaxID=5888 RepID=A0BEN5_PARTE|nr:uncharacterized protein GSPATT00028035001 [Paramecium tetraurelia]CAK57002.1 unnamed protein product [Paramecium tetraurelia]|eukprot:XP_001424400.1 hypothetical protein (macronuclear) [Paramecium tetraurelia strain d4-2]